LFVCVVVVSVAAA